MKTSDTTWLLLGLVVAAVVLVYRNRSSVAANTPVPSAPVVVAPATTGPTGLFGVAVNLGNAISLQTKSAIASIPIVGGGISQVVYSAFDNGALSALSSGNYTGAAKDIVLAPLSVAKDVISWL